MKQQIKVYLSKEEHELIKVYCESLEITMSELFEKHAARIITRYQKR